MHTTPKEIPKMKFKCLFEKSLMYAVNNPWLLLHSQREGVITVGKKPKKKKCHSKTTMTIYHMHKDDAKSLNRKREKERKKDN